MTPADPVISILLPTYNRASFLPETLDSLLTQTFADIEIIVVDDGSTDDTQAVLRGYTDRRLRIAVNPVNLGISAGTNTAFAMARGRFCAMADSDDVSAPDRLAKQHDYLSTHSEIDVLGTALTVVQDGKTPYPNIQPQDDESIKLGLITGIQHIANPSAMFRIEQLATGARFDPSVAACGDYAFWIDCAIAGARFAGLAEPLVRYRIHPNNISTTQGARAQRDSARVRARLLPAVFPHLRHEDIAAATTLFYYVWRSELRVVAEMVRVAAILHDMPVIGLGLSRERVADLIRRQLVRNLSAFRASAVINHDHLAMLAALYPTLAPTIEEAQHATPPD